MKRCSTLIRLFSLPFIIFSLLITLPCQGSQQLNNSFSAVATKAAKPSATTQQLNNSTTQQFNLLMQVRQREITGLCIMETASDSSIVGTVINEFGTKIFDFTYNNGKTRVFNLIAPINKWYIRRELRRDFQFILTNLKENGITVKRKRIIYTLTPITTSPLPGEVLNNQ